MGLRKPETEKPLGVDRVNLKPILLHPQLPGTKKEP